MALIFRNGDYLPDGRGGFRTATGKDETLERVLWKLSVRRGSFPFLPELGSRLHLLCRAPAGERQGLAEQYVKEALRDEALTVSAVRVTDAGEGRGELKLALLHRGRELTLSMEVGGLT